MRNVTVSIIVGPSPASARFARLARRLVDREHVVAVHADARACRTRWPCRRTSFDAVWHSAGTEMAQWLFSQMKTQGAFQTPAKFMPAWNSPSDVPPSPK